MLMTVYCGYLRETEVVCDVTDLGAGAGEIACLECGGSGCWAFAEPEIPGEDCVQCKGTGRHCVSIAP